MHYVCQVLLNYLELIKSYAQDKRKFMDGQKHGMSAFDGRIKIKFQSRHQLHSAGHKNSLTTQVLFSFSRQHDPDYASM